LSSSSTADYHVIATEYLHKEENLARWADEDENGQPGETHRYRRLLNNQGGSNTTRYKGMTKSRDRTAEASGGPVKLATAGLGRVSTTSWSHSDLTIDNDGDVTRAVSDVRTTNRGETVDRSMSGGPNGASYLITATEGGSGTVEVDTTYTGGWIGSGSGGWFINDADSITQRTVKSGTSYSTLDQTDDLTVGGPWITDNDETLSANADYTLSWTRPTPVEGQEGGPEDPGPVFTLGAYSFNYNRHSLQWDHSSEPEAHWASNLSTENNVSVNRSAAGGGQYNETVTETTTVTPFPWSTNPVTGSTTTWTATADHPVPAGPTNQFWVQTHDGYDYVAWHGLLTDTAVQDGGAAPALDDTFSAGETGPTTIVRDTHVVRMRHFADQESTPVEDNIPAPAAEPELPGATADECDCACGDDTGSDGDYFDQSGDWVGDVYGDDVDRRGKRRLLNDVEDFNAANPDATPSDWDAFFASEAGGPTLYEGLEFNQFIDQKYLPVLSNLLALKEKIDSAKTDAERAAFRRDYRSWRNLAETLENVVNKPGMTTAILERRQVHKLDLLENSEAHARARKVAVNGAIDIGLTGASLIPVVGEAMDAYILFASDSSLFDRGMSALSLGVSVLTGGLSPNFATFRHGTKAAGNALEATAEAGRKVNKLTDSAKNALNASSEDLKNIQCSLHGGNSAPSSIDLKPYTGPGGGHHVGPKKAFEGEPHYDKNTALAIPNDVMAQLGIDHPTVTGAQKSLYQAFASRNEILTWDEMRTIEIESLIRGGGAEPGAAARAVDMAIETLKNRGVTGPVRIPWGN
jgi:hypothetical protein